MKDFELIDLDRDQMESVEDALDLHDDNYIGYKLDGRIRIGISVNGTIVAGLSAAITAFRILYVSSLFVYKSYRRQGYGRILMEEMEKRAKALGANIIRVDTFDWQGKDFYEALGYECVGSYTCEADHYSEYFFLKRI